MLGITADSLLVRCGLAAAAYYLPQDLGVIALLSANKNSTNRKITGPKNQGPPEDKLDELIYTFMSDHNFSPATYGVKKSRRFTVIDVYD